MQAAMSSPIRNAPRPTHERIREVAPGGHDHRRREGAEGRREPDRGRVQAPRLEDDGTNGAIEAVERPIAV